MQVHRVGIAERQYKTCAPSKCGAYVGRYGASIMRCGRTYPALRSSKADRQRQAAIYGDAKRKVASDLYHWSHEGLNNRAENNHLAFLKRERMMKGLRYPGGLQRFVSVHSATRNRFSVQSHCRKALTIRYHRMEAFDAWKAAAHVA